MLLQSLRPRPLVPDPPGLRRGLAGGGAAERVHVLQVRMRAGCVPPVRSCRALPLRATRPAPRTRADEAGELRGRVL